MSTRLVERLEREIALAEDPLERECLKAQHAAVIARLGMLDQAKFTLSGLRTQSRRYRNPKLQAWVHFLSGTIGYFTAINSAQALEHFKAARLSAIECGDVQLQALACAWAGANEYQLRNDQDMVVSLSEAIQLADKDNHSVLGRAWLVMADAADSAGWYADSLLWYELARRHGVADGDAIMIYIGMRNRANSLAAHQVRQELFGIQAITSTQRALSEAESTYNFDQGLRNTALSSAAPLIYAEVLVVLGRWVEAAKLIGQYFDAMKAHGGASLAARQLASRAWCNLNMHQRESALADVGAAIAGLEMVDDPDDRAVVHQRVGNTLAAIGANDRAGMHFAEAAVALSAASDGRAKLATLLSPLKLSVEEMGTHGLSSD